MNRNSTMQVNRELFIVSLTIFITVLVWITVEVYHIKKSKEFEVQYQTSLQTVIQQIDKKKLESVTQQH